MTQKQDSFFLFVHPHGSCMEVKVAGSLVPYASNFVEFVVSSTFPDVEKAPIPQEKQEHFMTALAESRVMAYDYFSPAQIDAAHQGVVPKGFHLSRFIPMSFGGEDKNGNYILLQDEAAPILNDIWKQISSQIQILRKTGKKLSVVVPSPPAIVTVDHLRRWKESNAEAFRRERLKQKVRSGVQTVIHQETKSDGSILLRLTNHPFVNQPVIIFTLSDPIPQARSLFTRNTQLHKSLRRRDAALLKNLSPAGVYRIKKRGIFSESIKLQMHHLHPLGWGGQNEADNICFVTPAEHENFNRFIEEPLIRYLSETDLATKTVRIVLPIPLGAYQIRPPLNNPAIVWKKSDKVTPEPRAKKISAHRRKIENRKIRHVQKQYLNHNRQYA